MIQLLYEIMKRKVSKNCVTPDKIPFKGPGFTNVFCKRLMHNSDISGENPITIILHAVEDIRITSNDPMLEVR